MSEVTQTILVEAVGQGTPGNCLQAALASLIDRPLESVPHFVLWRSWDAQMVAWLAELGYAAERFGTREVPAERCLVIGRSPRGFMHVCVADQGGIVWDPHPSREGLTNVIEAWFVRPAAAADQPPTED